MNLYVYPPTLQYSKIGLREEALVGSVLGQKGDRSCFLGLTSLAKPHCSTCLLHNWLLVPG